MACLSIVRFEISNRNSLRGEHLHAYILQLYTLSVSTCICWVSNPHQATGPTYNLFLQAPTRIEWATSSPLQKTFPLRPITSTNVAPEAPITRHTAALPKKKKRLFSSFQSKQASARQSSREAQHRSGQDRLRIQFGEQYQLHSLTDNNNISRHQTSSQNFTKQQLLLRHERFSTKNPSHLQRRQRQLLLGAPSGASPSSYNHG